MRGRKCADENHPDYPEYIAKCKALRAEFEPREKEVEAEGRKEYPNWNGMDCPWGDARRALMKEENERLKQLQKQYSQIFTVEVEERSERDCELTENARRIIELFHRD